MNSKFNIGDKVVCLTDKYKNMYVKKNHTYTINRILPFNDDREPFYIIYFIENIQHITGGYYETDFILLNEYRKQKLERLCSK